MGYVLNALPTTPLALRSISSPRGEDKMTGREGYFSSRKWAMGRESIMWVKVGRWWIAGTVYLPEGGAGMPLCGIVSFNTIYLSLMFCFDIS